jgi:type I restriction enzyme, S subunit
VKTGWTSKPLEDACTFINGLWKGEKDPLKTVGVIRNTNFTKDGTLDDTDIAFIEVEVKKFDKRKLFAGDIILEKSGGGPKQAVGRVVLFDKPEGDYSFSNFTAAIRVKSPDELDAKYLHKFLHWTYLSGVTEEMQSNSTGIRNLDGDKYKAIQVSYPSIGNQRRIVTLLDEAFAYIAAAKANAEKNLQNTRELFNSFVQSLFMTKEDGWFQTTIGEQLQLQRGFDITKDQQTEGTVPVVSSGGIKSYHDTSMVDGPGVVIGRKGTLGKSFFLETSFWPHDTTLWVKDFKGNEPKLVYHLLSSLDLKKLDSGAANPALNRNQVHPLKIWWPDRTKQSDLIAIIDSMSGETTRLHEIYRQKLTALDDLKKSLLHQAFSGQL